jgi:hypothetical protein
MTTPVDPGAAEGGPAAPGAGEGPAGGPGPGSAEGGPATPVADQSGGNFFTNLIAAIFGPIGRLFSGGGKSV